MFGATMEKKDVEQFCDTVVYKCMIDLKKLNDERTNISH